MQTLKVFSCRSLKELPKDIKELVNLKHLDDNECGALRNMPRGLGQLTCLQTLPLFVVSKDSSSTTTKNVYYNKKKKKKKNHCNNIEVIAIVYAKCYNKI